MKRARVSWTQFKSILDTYLSNYVYIETENAYELFTFLGQKEVECIIFKDGGSDLTIFEGTYKAKGNKPISNVVPALPDPDGYKFQGRRIVASTVGPGSTNLDFVLPEELWLDGFVVKAFGSSHFNYVKLHIVAPIGHPLNPYPQEILVNEYAPSWGISDDLFVVRGYKAKIPSGLILRIVYVNEGAGNVDIWINAFLHKKV